MTPERWRELRSAFDELAALSPHARQSRLEALEGENEEGAKTAAELRALFAAESRDATFLTEPAALPELQPDDRRGERVGVWELLEPLGEGGMGRVFLARRADASFEKIAAVKLVHEELLSPQLRERFAAERQALAALEHPGIARLLDGGESARGEPYLVLEYVDGAPIVEYAVQQRLDARSRLELFLQVTAAVAHAHRHLVVHRDIKPSNVWVTRDGQTKLLDFGIAKILAPDAGGAGGDPAAARTIVRALTPAYASPEQLLGAATTTATDVYSLGVLLYELVVGESPYRVVTGAPEEWAAATLGQEPRSSARLAADLDAIVRKCLRKEPAARYATVDALGEDVGRFLDGRPVVARQGGALYRLARFARRHRGALGASLAGLAILVGAGERLRRERDRANAEAASARSVAAFLSNLFQNADPARARGAKLSAREVLDEGAKRIERDASLEPEVRARLLGVLGSVHRDLGLFDRARPMLERSLALREAAPRRDPRAVAEALHEVGLLDRISGDLDSAEARLTQALVLRSPAASLDELDRARTLAALATVHRMQGDPERARPRVDEALAIGARFGESAETGRWLNLLGLIHQDAGDFERARTAFAESLARIDRAEGAESPLSAIPLDNLGVVLRQLGRPGEGLAHHERAVALVAKTWGTEHPQYGNALNSLGGTLVALERRPEAIRLFEQAAEVYSAALGEEHPNVAWPLRNAAEALVDLDRAAEALPLAERALAIRRAALGDEHPDTALSLTDVGFVHAALGDLERAESRLREGLAATRASHEPTSAGLAEAQIFLADLLVRRGAKQEAVDLYREARSILGAAFASGDPRLVDLDAKLLRLGSSPAEPRAGL